MQQELKTIKDYLKVDHSYDDDLIKELTEVSELEIAEAISSSISVKELAKDPRFNLAVRKQVHEHYEHRADSADSERFELANGVLSIIQQLRFRSDCNEN